MSADHSEDTMETVVERMADAILYLSSVASKAGLATISEDLLSVRSKLQKGAAPVSPLRSADTHVARKARGVRR